MIGMPGTSYVGPLPPLTGETKILRDRLRRHVEVLAGKIGERSLFRYDGLQASAKYIETDFESEGLKVDSQEFRVETTSVRNLAITIPGSQRPEEIIVVGAHYDSVFGSPGANDNASGVAAVLEFPRLLAGRAFPRTIRYVAFVNEEPPFFRTRHMGSRVYARRCRERRENIVAMLSIETIGFYSNEKGSQMYPFPFSLFYPSVGNFIGFVGNMASGKLVRRCIAAFRQRTNFPSEGLAAPGWITGLGWSDHWAFWREGYPAIMVTDTAPFRYRHYHTAEDTPDKLDYDSTARVVAGLARVVDGLAGL